MKTLNRRSFLCLSEYVAGADIIEAAGKQGKPEFYTLYAGQGIGQIRNVISASEVVQQLMNELNAAYDSLTKMSHRT